MAGQLAGLRDKLHDAFENAVKEYTNNYGKITVTLSDGTQVEMDIAQYLAYKLKEYAPEISQALKTAYDEANLGNLYEKMSEELSKNVGPLLRALWNSEDEHLRLFASILSKEYKKVWTDNDKRAVAGAMSEYGEIMRLLANGEFEEVKKRLATKAKTEEDKKNVENLENLKPREAYKLIAKLLGVSQKMKNLFKE